MRNGPFSIAMFDYRRVIEQTAIAIVAAVAEVVAGIALVALVWSCSGRGRHRSGTRRKHPEAPSTFDAG